MLIEPVRVSKSPSFNGSEYGYGIHVVSLCSGCYSLLRLSFYTDFNSMYNKFFFVRKRNGNSQLFWIKFSFAGGVTCSGKDHQQPLFHTAMEVPMLWITSKQLR